MPNKTDNNNKGMNETIVIDAANAITGRLASFAAKQVLLGKKAVVINSEKAIIIGTKKNIVGKYAARVGRGRATHKGPYFPRQPEAILRRAIRGMLPYGKARGKILFRNVKCYASVPPEFQDVKKIKLGKETNADYLTLGEVSKLV